MSTVDKSTDDVELLRDGTWLSINEQSQKNNNMNEDIVVESSSLRQSIAKMKAESNRTESAGNSNHVNDDDIITLSDSDDEEDISPQSRQSNVFMQFFLFLLRSNIKN